MFSESTVFFLGAGASYGYGYPLGQNLSDEIQGILAQATRRDQYFQLGFSANLLDEFVAQLKHGHYWSIDELLAREKDLTSLGKLAICSRLTESEASRASLIHNKNLWYSKLISFMDRKKGDLVNNMVSFVTLNYDRSLEAFFHDVVPCRAKEGSQEFLASLKIIHLHGRLGALEGEIPSGTRYGQALVMDEKMIELSKKISVLHEAGRANPNYSEASKLINAANKVYFMGFGYHQAIMDSLAIDWSRGDEKFVGLTTNLGEGRQPTQYKMMRIQRGWNCERLMEVFHGTRKYDLER